MNRFIVMVDPLSKYPNIPQEQLIESAGILPEMAMSVSDAGEEFEELAAAFETRNLEERVLKHYGYPVDPFKGHTAHLKRDIQTPVGLVGVYALDYPDDPILYPCLMIAEYYKGAVETMAVYPYGWVMFGRSGHVYRLD